ncbi:hypothetical protein [Sphingobacterium faecium]
MCAKLFFLYCLSAADTPISLLPDIHPTAAAMMPCTAISFSYLSMILYVDLFPMNLTYNRIGLASQFGGNLVSVVDILLLKDRI